MHHSLCLELESSYSSFLVILTGHSDKETNQLDFLHFIRDREMIPFSQGTKTWTSWAGIYLNIWTAAHV